MKTKSAQRLLLFFSALALFTGCEAEKDYAGKKPVVKQSNSEISFTEFKIQTHLNDFKTTIKLSASDFIDSKKASNNPEASEFDIDTKLIKRLEIDNQVSYSFRIYPKIFEAQKRLYNLILFHEDGKWVHNIVELTPTIDNFKNLMIGSTNDIEGTMRIISSSSMRDISINNTCYTVGLIGNNCGSPQISENCVSKSYASFCSDNNAKTLLGEASEIVSNSNDTRPDYSFVLNTNDLEKNLKKFAENHVSLNNQILLLLQNERNVNFDDFPFTGRDVPQTPEELEQAFANAGIQRYEEMTALILRQNQNANDFIANNRDFASLDAATKERMVNQAIDQAVVQNPVNWPPVSGQDTAQRRTCYEQYVVDRDRCNRACNRNGAVALVACITTGPIGCAVACAAVLDEVNQCLQYASADYYDCIG